MASRWSCLDQWEQTKAEKWQALAVPIIQSLCETGYGLVTVTYTSVKFVTTLCEYYHGMLHLVVEFFSFSFSKDSQGMQLPFHNSHNYLWSKLSYLRCSYCFTASANVSNKHQTLHFKSSRQLTVAFEQHSEFIFH